MGALLAHHYYNNKIKRYEPEIAAALITGPENNLVLFYSNTSRLVLFCMGLLSDPRNPNTNIFSRRLWLS